MEQFDLKGADENLMHYMWLLVHMLPILVRNTAILLCNSFSNATGHQAYPSFIQTKNLSGKVLFLITVGYKAGLSVFCLYHLQRIPESCWKMKA